MRARWIVLRERSRLRWGGDLRRHYVLEALGSRRDAIDVDGWSHKPVADALERSHRWPVFARPRLAAATMLSADTLAEIGDRARPDVVDIHDDPIAQNAALGIQPDPSWLDQALARKRRNLAAFGRYIVPSIQLAEIAGIDIDRSIVAGNGSDTELIRPLPFPQLPAIGFMSGAATGRGIETLIAAARLVRTTVPDLRLILWLAATGTFSEAYLVDLQRSTVKDPWIEYGAAPYGQLGQQLGRVTIQCVPNPRSDYWDAVSPIKLFDAMASGRPVVVTPRTTMRADVERHQAGLVATGDEPEDLAEQLARLLADPALAARMGANGRIAAQSEYDWRAISTRLADRLVATR